MTIAPSPPVVRPALLRVAGRGEPQVEYGEVFTRRWVVDLILDLAGYTDEVDLTELVLVEPSVGSGAFLGAVISRLLSARRRHAPDRPWRSLAGCIRGWDLQKDHVEASKALAVSLLCSGGCPPTVAAMLADTWLGVGDFLLTDHGLTADVVVGNPPYIRIEDLPLELLNRYRAACPAMGGRADVFIGFYERGLSLLKPGGRLAFICADRWMRNAYGRSLRRMVVENYSVDTVLVMHDSDAFEADVSAYPAITVISRKAQGRATVARATGSFGKTAAQAFSAWSAGDSAELRSEQVTGAKLPRWHRCDDSWPEGGPGLLAWLERLEEACPVIESGGATRVGIGVATGADKVFVVDAAQAPGVEPDRLLPLSMAADIKSGEFTWTGKYLVNPWQRDGLVRLRNYPGLAAYVDEHGAVLKARHVARHNRQAWHRTIDRVNLGLLEQPLLLLQDLKARPHPVLAPPGYYPHHNLYYISSTEWDLSVLGGLLMSDAVERQISAFCVKMRGGTLRLQAQYLRRLRLPRPNDIAGELARELSSAFGTRDRERASRAAEGVYAAAGVPVPP